MQHFRDATSPGDVGEDRKSAYLYLLYAAILDIRTLGWRIPTWRQAFNPQFWRHRARSVRSAAAVAEWLHNMAQFSSNDFRGFDESRFWAEASHRAVDFPEFHRYK